jgi:peptidoglycan/LPS O-acetylase OafA/YrhL
LWFSAINIFHVNSIIKSMPHAIEALYWRSYGILNIEYNHLFSIGIAVFTIINHSVKDRLYKLACLLLAISNLTALTIGIERFIVSIMVTAILIGSFFWSPLTKLLSGKIFAWLGSISYILYLIHTNVGRIVISQVLLITKNVNFSVFFGVIFIVAVAAIFTSYVENPLRKFTANLLN